MARETYLVGSVPLRNAEEVFRTVAQHLGASLRWLPDGETGPRLHWLPWLQPIFSGHPQLEATADIYERVHENMPNARYRARSGVNVADVRFDKLPFAAIALASYREFARLKREGAIAAHVKFQVCLAGISSVARRFIVEEQQDVLSRGYETGLFDQIARMTESIPPSELAIQWDVASAVFHYLEAGEATRFGETPMQMLEYYTEVHARLGNAVPKEVDLLFHLCYGDAAHRHTIEPGSLRWPVEFANRLSRKSDRPIQAIHMPVPRNRGDDGYFEALRELKLKPETILALGLVHYTDGIDGTRARMAVAEKYRKEFAVATECGFGRRDAATLPKLLEIHAAAAGLR
ncbi:MAG: hypothetical protein EXR28_06210 [Betaproteobacteria bacterium]|nr:hypothetical protein [Betaproteobacteria bacterium]